MNTHSTDNRTPLISVIVPSFNQGAFIHATIKSVLGQDYQDWELIIQDACSSDDTEKVCNAFADSDSRIRFHREKDSGFADGVNRGLAKARGAICAIQSSDDFYAARDVFSEVTEYFTAHPETVLLAGDFRMVDKELETSPVDHGKSGPVSAIDAFTLKEHFPQGSVFFSAARARQVGGLSVDVDMVADTDFWIRMANLHPVATGSIHRVNRIWSYALMHENQRSADASRFATGRALMYFRFLENKSLSVATSARSAAFRSALVDAYHLRLQKCEIENDLRALHKSAFGVDVPWSWKMKAKILRIPALRRFYFRNRTLFETADFLAGPRSGRRNWFDPEGELPFNSKSHKEQNG
jgi:glycosyltransferase involved in cell wall biosynthesis